MLLMHSSSFTNFNSLYGIIGQKDPNFGMLKVYSWIKEIVTNFFYVSLKLIFNKYSMILVIFQLELSARDTNNTVVALGTTCMKAGL